MSDLDQAIRDDLAQRARETTPDAAYRSVVAYADAIRAVLDWATGLDADPVTGRDLLVTTLTRQVRENIAEWLGVSGGDRSEPTTRTPRVWPIGSDEPAEPGLVVHGNGIQFEYDSVWCRWRALPPAGDGDFHTWRRINNYPDGQTLTEVVDTPAGPQ